MSTTTQPTPAEIAMLAEAESNLAILAEEQRRAEANVAHAQAMLRIAQHNRAKVEDLITQTQEVIESLVERHGDNILGPSL